LLAASAVFAGTIQLDSPDGHLKLTFDAAANPTAPQTVVKTTRQPSKPTLFPCDSNRAAMRP